MLVITDLQQSGLASDKIATESLVFPADVPVQLIDVGRPAANNLAITDVLSAAKRLEPSSDRADVGDTVQLWQLAVRGSSVDRVGVRRCANRSAEEINQYTGWPGRGSLL